MPSRVNVTDTADYISKAAPAAQPILRSLTQLITTELPSATPKIKWHLPFWDLDQKYVSVAGYKAHVSLSISEELPETLLATAKAQGYVTGQKRLNIGLDQAVPAELVKAILALLN
ncbi:DUF1801 domain-containing protein [Lactiplantibacillus sp. WILCCON 0030]|uniref:DUF1801 domain-containing protein n=1 Tax=Lactiplantibacillus brownii TaxID=3069269 RepID=A0ABU1AAF4_9LACO|nr:DUF1801 domain-containing protein [Lactiplantibacillus brownii]MDQ7937900.1 DUF1801 domain-containing protein [Lactiplantibacillus brownii]